MDDKDVRVLMILDAFDIGGTETHVLSLTKELLKQGVSVFVAGDAGPLENKFRMLSCEVYNYKKNKEKFVEWIRINEINVIHAHLESSARYAVQLSRKLNIPLIYTIHGTYYEKSILHEAINKCSIKPTFISVSIPVQKWLEKEGIYSIHIPNGIDTNEFAVKKSDLKEKLNIPEKSRVLLYASRLEDEKYEICKLLLKACENKLLKEFPDMHLLIAGDGMKTEKIKTRINETIKSNRIQYVGNRLDMPDLYSISNYVVGTGRVALEAIFCERPVIAIGAAGTFGLVTLDNFDKALQYYFCDHKMLLPLNQANITNAVKDALLLENPNLLGSKGLRQQAEQIFGISIVSNDICKIYKKRIRKEEGYDLQ